MIVSSGSGTCLYINARPKWFTVSMLGASQASGLRTKPMSSPRRPPRPSLYLSQKKRTPSRWYSRKNVLMPPGTLLALSNANGSACVCPSFRGKTGRTCTSYTNVSVPSGPCNTGPRLLRRTTRAPTLLPQYQHRNRTQVQASSELKERER